MHWNAKGEKEPDKISS